jgi:hypothetical protein
LTVNKIHLQTFLNKISCTARYFEGPKAAWLSAAQRFSST